MISVELSHRNTGICQREKVAFDKDRIIQLIEDLKEKVGSVFILSTCNRFSIYSSADSPAVLIDFFVSHGVGRDQLTITYGPRDNAKALFETASGLRSQFYGERQILNQIRSYYQISTELGSLDQRLDLLIRSAIHTGKIVQKRTMLHKLNDSIVDSVCAAINKQHAKNKVLNIGLFGTGSMAKLVLYKLKENGFTNVQLISRDGRRASAIQDRYGVKVIDYNELQNTMFNYSVLIGATDRMVDLPSSLFKGGSVYQLIDLGVPRNFDPGLLEVPGVSITDLDALHASINQNAVLKQGIDRAFEMVSDEVDRFMKILDRENISIYIGAYWNKLQDISERETQWLLNRLTDLEQTDEQLISRYAHKLLRSISRDVMYYMNDLAGTASEPVMTREFGRMFNLKLKESE